MAPARVSTAPGHVGGALTTTVLPVSRAGMILLPMTAAGQLKGRTAATTPWGTRSTTELADGRGSQGLGHQRGQRPDHAGAWWPGRTTTPPGTLPCSRVSRAEVASRSIDLLGLVAGRLQGGQPGLEAEGRPGRLGGAGRRHRPVELAEARRPVRPGPPRRDGPG